jgi:REP element-mobilizing transposase RayT
MSDLPGFKPFDPDAEVRMYRRNLPHLRQEGATYFATFRQADSIPRSVLTDWQNQRSTWQRANGLSDNLTPEEWQTRYRGIPEARRRQFERAEARRLFFELDRCHGTCVFKRPLPRDILRDSLHFFDGVRLRIGDFVIMPNHCHAHMTPIPGQELEEILRAIKRHTSTQLGKQKLKSVPGTFWQEETHDHIVRDSEELLRIRKYIRDNPEKAKLIEGDYSYYRAAWLDRYASISDVAKT